MTPDILSCSEMNVRDILRNGTFRSCIVNDCLPAVSDRFLVHVKTHIYAQHIRLAELRCHCLGNYEDLSARSQICYILCALAVLVTNEFSASRGTVHENIVLVDHEIREVYIYQNQTCYTFLLFDK